MKNLNFAYLGLAIIILIAAGFYAGQRQGQPVNNQPSGDIVAENPALEAPIGSEQQQKAVSLIKKFASKEEYVAYLAQAQSTGYGYGRGGGTGGGQEEMLSAPSAMGEAGQKSSDSALPLAADNGSDRVSQTNVQVLGIDEPDIVKTDGKNLYISVDQPYWYYSEPQVDIMFDDGVRSVPAYRQLQQNTDIISAIPVKDMKKIAQIDKQGEMLLSGDTLIIFSGQYIYGYNIKDAANPKEVWHLKIENNAYLSAARLYDGKLYLVTGSYPDLVNPCPVKPLSLNDRGIEIPCTEIYHPIVPVSDVSTYYAFAIDPASGSVQNKLSFVGSAGQSVVYMSENALYISYTYSEDQTKILYDFIKTKASDVFPTEIISKIEKLQGYDIGSNAKMVELQQIIDRYFSGLDSDERLKMENELTNRMTDYIKQHKRGLLLSGIVKVPLDKFEITASGSVPGTPLNQFSLDEYQGNLRIATTVGTQGIYYWGGWNSQNSANDVYILDNELKIAGKIQDLGQGERIYSARFIKDKGYLVTFRQIDPFYVLDLADPKNPQEKGQLKIPGYSSYLHPLADNLILGIGMENSQVKLSLFDVSNPQNPKELDKYLLNEYWSDVSSTHHAFLQDKDRQIFFLPGGQNGYIFGYKDGKLSLQKAISNAQANRAVYIQNYLYIIGNSQIVVVDENNWERVNEIEF